MPSMFRDYLDLLGEVKGAQSGPGSIYDIARTREMVEFEEESDREYRELQTYGRKLSGFERFTQTLPVSSSEADVQDTLATVMGSTFAGGPAAAILNNPGGALRRILNQRRSSGIMPLTTYHGSPHRINNVTPDAPMGRFDLQKVGTGEGAQAYGHGIYLAENPAVAMQYKEGLRLRHAPAGVGSSETDNILRALDEGDIDSYIKSKESLAKSLRDEAQSSPWGSEINLGAADDADSAAKFARQIKADPDAYRGSFYTVDLPDEHIAKMLDWDAPLSEQPKRVRAALMQSDAAKRLTQMDVDARAAFGKDYADDWMTDLTAGSLYREMAEEMGAEGASGWLNRAGIPGIKYFDGSSRAAGKGTRNFVVFDPSIVKILSRE